MHFYISGALMGAADLKLARRLYEEAAKYVQEAGYKPYLPHSRTDPELEANVQAIVVYRKDLQALRFSSGVIAFLDEPSLGVGAEIAICGAEKIPILGLHKAGVKVSRFAVGCLIENGGRIFEYMDDQELQREIHSFITDVSVNQKELNRLFPERFLG